MVARNTPDPKRDDVKKALWDLFGPNAKVIECSSPEEVAETLKALGEEKQEFKKLASIDPMKCTLEEVLEHALECEDLVSHIVEDYNEFLSKYVESDHDRHYVTMKAAAYLLAVAEHNIPEERRDDMAELFSSFVQSAFDELQGKEKE